MTFAQLVFKSSIVKLPELFARAKLISSTRLISKILSNARLNLERKSSRIRFALFLRRSLSLMYSPWKVIMLSIEWIVCEASLKFANISPRCCLFWEWFMVLNRPLGTKAFRKVLKELSPKKEFIKAVLTWCGSMQWPFILFCKESVMFLAKMIS